MSLLDDLIGSWLGLSLAAAFAAVVAVIAACASAWQAAPPDDRRFADPLPWPWRPVWPVVRRLAPLAGACQSAHGRERLRERLARAGLDRSLSPEQFIAGQVVAAALTTAVMAAVSADSASGWSLVAMAALLGAALPAIALRDRALRRRQALLRQLPHDIDLLTLAVEAGLSLTAALGQTVRYAPPGPLRQEWQRVLRDMQAGQPRHEALRQLAARVGLPAVSNLVAALLAAERQGASLAPILRAQAEQRRNERFLRAERLAMQAPVKMLLPLVLCIFPGTFAIVLFPIVMRLLQEGVL